MTKKDEIDVEAELARIREERHRREGITDGWSLLDESIASDDCVPAPAFDPEAIPPKWLTWIAATAEDCGSAPDYVALYLFALASNVLGNVRHVSPWGGWEEPPHLWGVSVGNPSTHKTSSLKPFQDACHEIERHLRPEFDRQRKEYELQKETADVVREEWKKQIKAAQADNKEPKSPRLRLVSSTDEPLPAAAPPMPDNAEAPSAPKPQRVLIADVTTEEAQSLLSGNPRGLALLRSELAAWFGAFDKQGADASRGFYNESWDGKPHSVDRVKFDGKQLSIPFCSLSIIGGIQPEKLAKVFEGPDDGLWSRFLYVYPDPVPPRRPTGSDSAARRSQLFEAFGLLRALKWNADRDGNLQPVVLGLDDQALRLLDAFREKNWKVNRTRRGLMASWRGKNDGRLLRLALVFEHLEWAMRGGIEPKIISGESVQLAERYLDYAEKMMEHIFGDAQKTDAQRDAAEIARYIRGARPDVLNERSLYQHRGFSRLRDQERRKAALAELETAGWIRRAPREALGRPAGDWAIHPGVFPNEF